MVDPARYTVGWICALGVEYVAARAFLDQRHPRPNALSANDNNQYTLGDVRDHLLVIAVLPDGEYGVSSAASVARDMLHSFLQDIRLVDVVVSSSRGGNHGGLLCYDLGKKLQGSDFLRQDFSTGHLSYEQQNQLEKIIQMVLERNARMRRKYAPPGSHNDRLYKSDYVTVIVKTAAMSSGTIWSCSVGREEPATRMTPAIHYGQIASGSKRVRNALFRVRMAVKQGILCFEMEATGLANHFPCLVVRGTCDYADSRKSKVWQGYAAMTAAAYAKDLLYQIVPQQVMSEHKASGILSS
ncbi:nucleoside phosphorylase domain-containing protein [Aspergillus fruticulosus]